MKVSALCGSGYMNVRIKAEYVTDALYMRLFSYATNSDKISNLNNTLLVNLGLIKVRYIFHSYTWLLREKNNNYTK